MKNIIWKEYLFCFRYPCQHDINNKNLLCALIKVPRYRTLTSMFPKSQTIRGKDTHLLYVWFSIQRSPYCHWYVSVCVFIGQEKPFVEKTITAVPLPCQFKLNVADKPTATSIRIINVRASTNQWIRLICNDLFDSRMEWIKPKNSFYSIYVRSECTQTFTLALFLSLFHCLQNKLNTFLEDGCFLFALWFILESSASQVKKCDKTRFLFVFVYPPAPVRSIRQIIEYIFHVSLVLDWSFGSNTVSRASQREYSVAIRLR